MFVGAFGTLEHTAIGGDDLHIVAPSIALLCRLRDETNRGSDNRLIVGSMRLLGVGALPIFPFRGASATVARGLVGFLPLTGWGPGVELLPFFISGRQEFFHDRVGVSPGGGTVPHEAHATVVEKFRAWFDIFED